MVDEQKPIADETEPTSPDEAVTGSSIPSEAESVNDVSDTDAPASDTPEAGDAVFAVDEDGYAEWADGSEDDDSEDAGSGDADDVEDVAPLEEIADVEEETPAEDLEMDWYILKVQSNREDSIAAALQRKVAIAGFEKYFDEIVVPVEMVTEFKAGKRRVVRRKLYPGYIVVHMAINDETWFLVRETSGIGDFTGSAGRPTPMLPQEVNRIIKKDDEVVSEEPKLQIGFRLGDQVKINEGTFENFEGEVEAVDATSGRVTVMINIFGRSTPVELEHWQIEAV